MTTPVAGLYTISSRISWDLSEDYTQDFFPTKNILRMIKSVKVTLMKSFGFLAIAVKFLRSFQKRSKWVKKFIFLSTCDFEV